MTLLMNIASIESLESENAMVVTFYVLIISAAILLSFTFNATTDFLFDAKIFYILLAKIKKSRVSEKKLLSWTAINFSRIANKCKLKQVKIFLK